MNWINKNKYPLKARKHSDFDRFQIKKNEKNGEISQDFFNLHDLNKNSKNSTVTIYENLEKGIKRRKSIAPYNSKKHKMLDSNQSNPHLHSPTNTIPFVSDEEFSSKLSSGRPHHNQEAKSSYSRLHDTSDSISEQSALSYSQNHETPNINVGSNFYYSKCGHDASTPQSQTLTRRSSSDARYERNAYRTNWSHSPYKSYMSPKKKSNLLLSSKSESPLSKRRKFVQKILSKDIHNLQLRKRNSYDLLSPKKYVQDWVEKSRSTDVQMCPPIPQKRKRKSLTNIELHKISLSPLRPKTDFAEHYNYIVRVNSSDPVTPFLLHDLPERHATTNTVINTKTEEFKSNKPTFSATDSKSENIKSDSLSLESKSCNQPCAYKCTTDLDFSLIKIKSEYEPIPCTIPSDPRDKNLPPASIVKIMEVKSPFHKNIALLNESLKQSRCKYEMNKTIDSKFESTQNVKQSSKLSHETGSSKEITKASATPKYSSDNSDVTYLKSEFCVQCQPCTKEFGTQTDNIFLSSQQFSDYLSPLLKDSIEAFINKTLNNSLTCNLFLNQFNSQKDSNSVLIMTDKSQSVVKHPKSQEEL